MPKIMVCRCEDVPEVEIRNAVKSGLRDMESLKRYLAIGTGPCQGKHCMNAIARILEEESGKSVEGVAPYVSRPPITMVPLGDFAARDAKEDRHEG